MKKKRTPRPGLEEIVPDEGKRKEMLRCLYQDDSILGEGGIFTQQSNNPTMQQFQQSQQSNNEKKYVQTHKYHTFDHPN